MLVGYEFPFRVWCGSDIQEDGMDFMISRVVAPGTFDYRDRTGNDVRENYCAITSVKTILQKSGCECPLDVKLRGIVTFDELVAEHGAVIEHGYFRAKDHSFGMINKNWIQVQEMDPIMQRLLEGYLSREIQRGYTFTMARELTITRQ